jgi:very-short-patch-repair endonuclease
MASSEGGHYRRVQSVGFPMDPDSYFELVLSDAEPGFRPKLDQRPAAKWRRWWQQQFDMLSEPGIERLARESGFVVTRADAVGTGTTPARVRHAVARRRWSAPAQGIVSPIVVPPPDPTDPSGQWVAARREHALRAAGAARKRQGHVVSGRSAPILHGLPTLRVPSRPELTAVGPATLGRHHGALVRSATTTDQDVTTWFGAPVTTVARTVVDLARHDRRNGLMAADAALYECLVTPGQLTKSVTQATGWPGVRRARAVLALADRHGESPLESLVRLALHDDGFPVPQLQVRIGGYRVDFLWPEQRVILEADGRVKYAGHTMWQEKQRERALHRLGYRVIRVFWSDLREWPPFRDQLWAELAGSSPKLSQSAAPA